MGQPPGMAEGGLLSVPIPDNMFDEPDNGGYAGGGIVAFAAGDEVDEDYSGSESDDELAGGDAGDNYAAFLAKQARERADKEADNKRKNAERRQAYLAPKPEAAKPAPDVAFHNSALGRGLQLSDQQKVDAEKDRKAFHEQYAAREQAKEQAKGDRREYAQKHNDRNRQMTDELYANLGARGKNFVTGLIGGNYVDVPKRTDHPKVAVPSTLLPSGEAKPIPKASAPSAAKAPAKPAAAAKAPTAPAAAPRAPVQAAPRPQGGLMAAAQARGIGGAPAAAVAPRGAAGVPGAPAASTGVVGAPTGAPGEFYGQSTDPKVQMEQLKQLAGIDPAAAQELKDYYAKTASPEAMASQKKQDMWSSLAQIGFGMAGSNSPSFMQAAGQSASAAMPGMMQAAKDRKAAERDAMKARYDIQKGENQEKLAMASSATASAVGAAKGLEDSKWKAMDADLAERGLAQRERLAIMQENGANGRAMMQIAAANARENNVSAKDIASMRLKAYEVANDYIKANAGNPRAAKQDLDAVAAQVFANMSEGFKPPSAAPPAGAGGARKPLGSFVG
jgi:hypothetical protein